MEYAEGRAEAAYATAAGEGEATDESATLTLFVLLVVGVETAIALCGGALEEALLVLTGEANGDGVGSLGRGLRRSMKQAMPTTTATIKRTPQMRCGCVAPVVCDNDGLFSLIYNCFLPHLFYLTHD